MGLRCLLLASVGFRRVMAVSNGWGSLFQADFENISNKFAFPNARNVEVRFSILILSVDFKLIIFKS